MTNPAAPAQPQSKPGRAATAARRELGAACAALALGSVTALGALSRTWVEITAPRSAPLPPVHLAVSGRSLSPAAGGLALVLLAGAAAVLATSGRARQALGGVLGLLSAALILVAAADATGVSDAQARRTLDARFSGIGLSGTYPVQVTNHVGWSWLCVVGGVLCLLGSIAVLVRGGRWRAMSARYDRPASSADAAGAAAAPDEGEPAPGEPAPGEPARRDPASDEDAAAAADLALWNALDRGDDPTRR